MWIVELETVVHPKVRNHGKGPSRSLLRDYVPLDGTSFPALLSTHWHINICFIKFTPAQQLDCILSFIWPDHAQQSAQRRKWLLLLQLSTTYYINGINWANNRTIYTFSRNIRIPELRNVLCLCFKKCGEFRDDLTVEFTIFLRTY